MNRNGLESIRRKKEEGRLSNTDILLYTVIKSYHTMEYRIDLKDCPGKIVLATYVEDFCDENKLETEILLQRIEFL